jgi:Domain of unknown function (DUF4166)/Saccharopine dehydrogenase NADP binding domain
MNSTYRILIVGGYGTFGGRLVELLEDDARLTLLVAGRSLEQARRYCAQRTAAVAALIPTAFDRVDSDVTTLRELRVHLVVDASGPFQTYGVRRYSLIEHCIEARVNYLDLADGADFVSGVAQFDAAARAAGVYILSGVSSFPVLTAAVVRHLSDDVARITSIRGGIAPSPYAGVGLNVIRAITSYAGQPICLKRSGTEVIGYPITESMRFAIAVPGHVPLQDLRFSLVDVPDLRALTQLWPEADEVWMGAGPVPATLHWLLSGFAWLVRLRLLPTLSWMAPAIYFVANRARWGEHRGGMFVAIAGVAADGSTIRREWHLLAEGNDGPLIPSMAVEALVRNALDGKLPPPGARTAIADLALSDYEALFVRRAIFTGVRQRAPAPIQPLFREILGDALDRLPEAITRLHATKSEAIYAGRCTVTQGNNPIARAIAALIGFPKAGTDLPIMVQLSVEGSTERWVRTVRERVFSSTLSPAGRSPGLMRERFGVSAFDIALTVQGQSLAYVLRGWSLLGVRMPQWLGPKTITNEYVDAKGRFCFDVKLWHPFIGSLVHYAGWLEPQRK